MQFKEVFLTPRFLGIAMEYAGGGDMFEFFVRNKVPQNYALPLTMAAHLQDICNHLQPFLMGPVTHGHTATPRLQEQAPHHYVLSHAAVRRNYSRGLLDGFAAALMTAAL